MAHRRRRLYEDQGARTSILAGAAAPRPDTLTQTGQITSHMPLADGAGHTFFKRQPEPGDRRPHRAIAQPNTVRRQQPCPQRRQREVWVGLDVYRQRALLRWRQLARPVPPSRTGAPLAGPAAADQRLVNVGHADPQQCRRSARRHAAVNRRENPRPQILRIALPLTPSHRRPQHLVSGNTESHFPSLWNPPATDSTQCGYALEYQVILLGALSNSRSRLAAGRPT